MFLLFLLAFADGVDERFISHEDWYKPSLIRVAPDGRIFVPDSGEHTVWIFDKQGTFLKQIGRSGQGPGELSKPSDVGFLADGDILIADSGNRRIHRFSADGTFKKMVNIVEQPVGRMLVRSDGMLILSRAAGFNFTLELEKDQPKRFSIYDVEGKLQGGFGHSKTHENMLLATMLNNGSIALQGDRLVFAALVENELVIYEGEKESTEHFPLTFEPMTPEAVQKETKLADGSTSINFSVSMDVACRGLAVLNDHELLLLRATAGSDDSEEGRLTQLIKINMKGELLKVYPGKRNAGTLALSPDKRFVYTLNELEDEEVITRIAL